MVPTGRGTLDSMATQLRAFEPDETGTVTRDGVAIGYEVFGSGATTILLMPTWTIISSRFWKAQIPYLSRHFRVVSFDGRGNGRSDRPRGAAAYANEEYAADALAVLDATGTDRAVVVGLSCAVTWSLHLAADQPRRVDGIVAIGAACGFPVPKQERDAYAWDERLTTTEGWAKYNRHHWLEGGYDDFVDFFFHQMYSEPHSTKQIEDCISWAHETTPQVVVDSTAARLGCDGVVCGSLEEVARRVRCPVLAIHGTHDRIRPVAISERLVELTGGQLVLFEGSGHAPLARDPVRLNLLVRDFAARVTTAGRTSSEQPGPATTTWTRAARRRRRALYLSSPIGLGHVRRDLAIADELRKLQPDLEISWLAQHPVTTLLEAAGEQVHPASRWLASESRHVEHDAGEHDLHAFEAIRRMDEVLVANFMLFDEVVRDAAYDLVIGDEAWEVDHFLHENPELKRFPFVWMTDFVGWLPMPDGGPREAALTADLNAEMLEHRARHRWVRDRSIFVGTPDDVVADTFGPGLPSIRDWTVDNFDFSGYVTGPDPLGGLGREALRRRLGWSSDRPVCVVTVGGSGVGEPLLRRALDAVPLARRQVDGLRFLVVAGPRIDPASLPRRRGATVRGFVPDLPLHLAAADVAVVQGGLSTCMELTASRTPFVYVPLRHHFEQNLHVRHRLDRYRAGHHLPYEQAADPDTLAAAVVEHLGRPVDCLPVEDTGAAVAAGLLAELL